MKKVWQTTSSKIVHQNPWWRVREDKVIMPDGKPGSYYVVQPPHDFVVSIPLDLSTKTVHLVRQWRHPIGKDSWEFPMGGMEKGETPLRTAKRELLEEAGLFAEAYTKLGKSYVVNGLSEQAFFVYVATGLRQGKHAREGSESDMIQKTFSVKKVSEMIASGVITDASTIVAHYYLLNYPKKI